MSASQPAIAAPRDSAPKPLPKPPLLILVALSAVGPLALNIFVPAMPGLQASFGVPYATAQLTLTLYLIGTAVCQLFYGPLSDRFGRRPLILAGQALFAVASLICALAPTIEVLIAGRTLQAVGGAAGIVLSRAVVRDLYGREKSASVLGYITMAWVLAPMLAPSVGGLLDGFGGWSVSYYYLAGLGALVWLAALRYLHETHFELLDGPALAGLIDSYRSLLGRPKYVAYTLTLGFASGVFFSFLAGAPYVMVVSLGQTPLDYGLWFILVSFGYMGGNGLSGRFSERIGVERMIGIGTALGLTGAGLCLAVTLAGQLSPLSLFGAMFLVALGNGLALPNGIAAAMSINPRIAGTAVGLAGFIQMGLGALTSQTVGLLQVQTEWAMFYVMVVSATLAVLMHHWARAVLSGGKS